VKEIISPIDGKVAFTFQQDTFEQALSKIELAERAQKFWAQTPIDARVTLCQAMLKAYAAHIDTWSLAMTQMMGKPLAQARGEFERSMTERVLHLCELAPAALADDIVEDNARFRRLTRREPVGVVLDIAAWNYPLLTAINVVVPAVLAGNAVIIKHAEQTALVGDHLAQAFAEAGAPSGLVQAMHIDHPTAARLFDTRRFGYVAFTGSVRGGHEVYAAVARQNFINVGLELGGKDAALVLPDADFEKTVDTLVDGKFYNAGQSCCAVERIYVHQSLYKRFVEAFVARVHEYVLGNPLHKETSLGPLVNAQAAQRMHAHVAEAVQRGARLCTDASRFTVPDFSPCYVAPCVLEGVDHDMQLMREETFAPAIGLMSFSTDEEGIKLMNDSAYGLTASIWTQDLLRGEALAQATIAGTVFVNRCDYVDPGLAWTGVKDSGVGCSLSKLGFAQLTQPKNFHIRTFDS